MSNTGPHPAPETVSGGTPVFSATNLAVSFRDRSGEWTQIVHEISFDISAGETLAMVGESGSGKSVSAMAVMRLLDTRFSHIDGRVALDGRNLLELSEPQMRRIRGDRIAMIFQEPMTSLNPVLTIGDQISEVLATHREMSKRDALRETIRLLERVRIPSAATTLNDYPHQASGGMRQRFMIAMALACRPRLLIADEPTTALDVTIQAQILELIRRLQTEEEMAVLFITHDMGVVAEVSDRTTVMHDGQMVETATTATLFDHPVELYTRTLLSAVPRLGSMAGTATPAMFPLVERANGTLRPGKSLAAGVAEASEPLLNVQGLTVRYDSGRGLLGRPLGRVHAVEDISFRLQPGETLALVGESGCGKSSAGRAILRLVGATAGSVLLNGEDVLSMSTANLRKVRRTIQMIFQDPFASLDPRRRVGESIAEPFLAHGLAGGAEAQDRVADLMSRVGLDPDAAGRFPGEFSGGQRQRICIARALALEPTVIVADEAVSALDVSIKAQVANLMMELQEQMKLGYLFISHDMAVVERISHRVGVMYLGEIVEIGPRAAVFENPHHPYTKRLLSAVPVPDPTVRGHRRTLAEGEVRSPVRPPNYVPPARQWRQVAPGHQVMIPDPEWKNEIIV